MLNAIGTEKVGTHKINPGDPHRIPGKQSHTHNSNIMTVTKLILQYMDKIEKKDFAIDRMKKMVTMGRRGDKSIDVEDLQIEIQNARRDRQLYFQFTKDLESLEE